MARYLISFLGCAMDHIPEQEWSAVGEAALAWAAKIATACRCAQEVREFTPDPFVGS